MPAFYRNTVQVADSLPRIPLLLVQAEVTERPANAKTSRIISPCVSVCAAVLMMALTGCSAQAIVHFFTTPSSQPTQPAQPAQVAQTTKPAQYVAKHEPKPKPEPSRQELVDYIRGRLLSLSPSDGVDDNLEVAFNPSFSISPSVFHGCSA